MDSSKAFIPARLVRRFPRRIAVTAVVSIYDLEGTHWRDVRLCACTRVRVRVRVCVRVDMRKAPCARIYLNAREHMCGGVTFSMHLGDACAHVYNTGITFVASSVAAVSGRGPAPSCQPSRRVQSEAPRHPAAVRPAVRPRVRPRPAAGGRRLHVEPATLRADAESCPAVAEQCPLADED